MIRCNQCSRIILFKKLSPNGLCHKCENNLKKDFSPIMPTAHKSDITTKLPEFQNHQVSNSSDTLQRHENLSYIPQDIIDLLWFKNGPLANYNAKEEYIHLSGFKVSMGYSWATEPSLIDLSLPVSKSLNYTPDRPPYFPTYSNLTPDQKGYYLNWLKNINNPIDVGYMFIFYYGLERHLLFGEFEKAFDMVLKLRQLTDNKSFQSYSADALLISLMLHKRADLLSRVNWLTSTPQLYIFVKAGVMGELSAEDLITIHKNVGFTNNRYIKNNYDMFIEELKKLLVQDYGIEFYKIDVGSAFKDCKLFSLMLANFSLTPEARNVNLPDITTNPKFQSDVFRLLSIAHENTKLRLRKERLKE